MERYFEHLTRLRLEAVETELKKEDAIIRQILEQLVARSETVFEINASLLEEEAKNVFDSIITTPAFEFIKTDIKHDLYNRYEIDSRSSIWDRIPHSDDIFKFQLRPDEDKNEGIMFKLSELINIAKRHHIEVQLTDLKEPVVKCVFRAILPTMDDIVQKSMREEKKDKKEREE